MYQTIIENTTYEIVEKKSKFIANFIYVKSKDDAEEKIKEIIKVSFDSEEGLLDFLKTI